MVRALLAGGGIALIGVFAGALYFVSVGGPSSSGQMTGNEALTAGLVALLGGIGSLFLSFRLKPASSWIVTVVGWILGFHLFPSILTALAVMIFAGMR